MDGVVYQEKACRDHVETVENKRRRS